MGGLRPLDESKWLEFEEKLVGNFSIIAGDPDPIQSTYLSNLFELKNISLIILKEYFTFLFFKGIKISPS
jgi:hypothetical protein